MVRDSFFIVTGAMGSGKSTLLHYLETLGHPVVAEPARRILAEQRGIDGAGIPGKDDRLFVELMLSRMMDDYNRFAAFTTPVLFDRGIPDMLAYAGLFGIDYPPGRSAAQEYLYNRRVFFAPAWEQIYVTDAERIMSFELARQFGEELRIIYQQFGYELIELPLASVEERAEFIRGFL